MKGVNREMQIRGRFFNKVCSISIELILLWAFSKFLIFEGIISSFLRVLNRNFIALIVLSREDAYFLEFVC